MNKSLRAIMSLSWQSVAYGIGTLGSQLLIYFMLPFLTRYMTQEEYGVVSVIVAIYAFLNMLTNAGLPQATFQYFNKNQDEKDQQITISSSQFLFFLYSAIPAAFILLFSHQLSLLLLGSAQDALSLQIVAGYLVFESMNTFGSIVLRIEVRPIISSLHSIITIACKIGLALLFVINYEMGGAGYWLGHLIGSIVGLLFIYWLIRGKLALQISWNRLLDLAKYGIPLIPANISMTILRLADRYIISALAGFDQVAIYDVGYKIGTILLFLITPFRTAWIPFAFSIAHTTEAPKTYRDVLTYITAGCSFLVLMVMAFRKELVSFIAPAAYATSANIVGWIAVSQIFLAAYHVFSIGAMVTNKTRDLARAALFAGGINILLNFVLIPHIGILGAAIATLAGYAFLAALTFNTGRQLFNMSVDWTRLGKLFIGSIPVIIIILIIENLSMSGWGQITLKLFGLLTFPAFLLLVGFINSKQIKYAIDFARNILNEKISTSTK
jgi:O-antigen/teichoic acid export membrane protein